MPDGLRGSRKIREYSVTPSRSEVPAGLITFNVTNRGDEHHEFMVVKTNLAPNALPVEADGSDQEDGPSTDMMDEIEMIMPDESEQLAMILDPGHYVLLCNMVMVEGTTVEAHYALWMRTAFTVE